MLDFRECIGDSAPDPLSRGIGRHEPRILLFEGLQLVEKAVVSGVFDLRFVEHVVAVIVVPDLFGEILVTRFGIRRNERWGRHHFASGSTAASPEGSGTAQSRIRPRRTMSATLSRR